jgi:hypothetical protein
LIKKRRDKCIVLLDDCFDCRSAAVILVNHGFSIKRFSEEFPKSGDPSKREQSIKDSSVIKLCHAKGYLLFTSDKSMREAHAEELRKTDIGIVATSSFKEKEGTDLIKFWTDKFFEARSKIFRDFKGRERPYFSVLHQNGDLMQMPITAQTRAPKGDPGIQTNNARYERVQ